MEDRDLRSQSKSACDLEALLGICRNQYAPYEIIHGASYGKLLKLKDWLLDGLPDHVAAGEQAAQRFRADQLDEILPAAWANDEFLGLIRAIEFNLDKLQD
ncbi:hypothetical protein KQI84_13880 [bacterium]|nr:hypothetical protein [bacterium]